MSEGGYIQGAADDSEAWALGLTPDIFWQNKDMLLGAGEENLSELIGELARQYQQQLPDGLATLIKPTSNIYIGKKGETRGDISFDLLIDCNGDITAPGGAKRLNLGCGSRKLGSRDLRKVLEKAKDFVSSQLARNPSQLLLVTCNTGKDLAVGTVLMMLCLFYDDDGKNIYPQLHSKSKLRCFVVAGEFVGRREGYAINKQYIRQRLAWIVSSKHDVNPSRATLQSVNSFLMSPV
jgi:tRNA A64-2'-O-ribosylphosphate transferase